MPTRVQYPETIEPLVQFIEETPPTEIVDRTLEKLRAGMPTQTMLTASALAVSRSSDLPPGHHGGPLHPLAGLYAVSKLVAPKALVTGVPDCPIGWPGTLGRPDSRSACLLNQSLA